MSTPADPLFLIYDPDGNRVTATCSGPDGEGRCPQVLPGEPVPCAGMDLILLHSDLSARWVRAVGAEDECPLPVLCAGGS